MKRMILDKRFWLIPFLIWSGIVTYSWLWNCAEMDRHVHDLATSQGRFVFRIIEATRLWNAQHGGVYVQVTPTTQPNPYLDVPNRDIITSDGKILTLVNPAYMTRQLSRVIKDQLDMTVRLTSLKPLNPVNLPDQWERNNLKAFENGLKERLEFFPLANGKTETRYIAPLLTQKPCLQCHEKQGYKVGDVRGAISIQFAATPLTDSISIQKHNLALTHILIRPDLSVNQAAYLTCASWKNFFTRSGDFSSVCMCSAVAAFSLALVRTGTFV